MVALANINMEMNCPSNCVSSITRIFRFINYIYWDENIRPEMSSTTISLEDFPKPIVSIIEALDSEQRRRVLMELETRSLSYSEILQQTRLDKGTLNYHLKKLVAAGMVRNFLVDQQVSPYTSYYEVSGLGRKVVDSLFNVFRPHVRHVRATFRGTYDFMITEGVAGERATQDAASTPPSPEMRENIPIY